MVSPKKKIVKPAPPSTREETISGRAGAQSTVIDNDYDTKVETALQGWASWASRSKNPHYEISTIEDTVRHLRALSRNCDIFDREAIIAFVASQRTKKDESGKAVMTKKKENELTKYVNRWGAYRRSLGEEWDHFDYIPVSRQKYRISVFTEQEAKTLLKRTRGPNTEDFRNHAMLALGLNYGLRRAEISNLQVAHIHRGYVEVLNGKGEKDRDVIVVDDGYTYGEIQEYLARRNHQESKYLFTTRKGQVTDNYMEKIAGDIRRITGNKGFRWLKCRHTYATKMLKEGVDIVTLSHLLGHADVRTTIQYYASFNQDDAFNAVKKVKPKMFRED